MARRKFFRSCGRAGFAAGHAEELKQHRALMKDSVIWNTEQGLKLSALDVARAQAARGLLFQRVHEFFERYDFLLLPVAQVLPFPIETDWVQEINGVTMETYIDWDEELLVYQSDRAAGFVDPVRVLG